MDNSKIVFSCIELNKEFQDGDKKLKVLSNLQFSIMQGEFVCVVGPSGCGKSTLLRIIAELLPATSGEISFSQMQTARPRTSMVFQGQGLFPWMSVLDNVVFGLKMQGVSRAVRDSRALELLEKVGLKDFIKAYPHTLSGGMRQRVAILRAFLSDPEILLMDEPFGMLDYQTKIVMQEELLNLWQERQHTVVYITHDIEEAIFLGDRILVMSGRPGRILADIPVHFMRPRKRDEMLETTREIRLRIWNMLHDEVTQDLGIKL